MSAATRLAIATEGFRGKVTVEGSDRESETAIEDGSIHTQTLGEEENTVASEMVDDVDITGE